VPQPNDWAEAALPAGPGRSADVIINGYALACEIPLDDAGAPTGPTAFGLLAASLSACTAMSARTFLERWRQDPSTVAVHVAVQAGRTPVLHRRVTVDAALSVDLREQLAAVVDTTPITVLLRDSVPILTEITSGHDAGSNGGPDGRP
jgi:putative redox protein